MHIAVTHIASECSPYYINMNKDVIRILKNDINNYHNLGQVFVTGDMNSRTGHKPDYILNYRNLGSDDISD